MNPVSPKLVIVRYLSVLPWVILPAVGFLIAGIVLDEEPKLVRIGAYVGAGIFAGLMIWLLWLIPAQVKKLGWKETADELLLSRGKVFHTYTVVPYGRIQFVDVTAGPIERIFGLKSVELHTASASSDSSISGLVATEADALRDRLAVQARERMSGL
ncbi:PH domain-containing protein [Corynebacterium spheniscorum]|nr:PH domain-containing protein [Corynebacterium spheniscorum]KAA8723395.1 PH domain-containing protein [Corynebacterium spheniscorum]